MSDLLDAFDTGGQHEEAIDDQRLYQDKQSPCEYSAKVLDYGFGVIDNKQSKLNGQSFLSMTLEVVEGTKIPLSTKVGKNKYEPVQGRVGDKVSLWFSMSSVGKTESEAKAIFRGVCDLAAVLTGNRAADYTKDGAIGPQGLREVFDDSGRHLGKVLRFVGLEENQRGYFNPRVELIPSDEAEAPAKGKAKKAS